YRLAESFGIKADRLAGHSIGEIAAAHVAGVFSLEDACTLISARASLMQALPTGGALIAIEAREDEITPLLTEGVSIAAVNGPNAVVIAGVEQEARRIVEQLNDSTPRKFKQLPVSHAFHSPLMEPMLDDFRAAIAGISFNNPTIPLLTSGIVQQFDEPIVQRSDQGSVQQPEYWVRHVREAVRFHDTVRALDGSTFLEIGPDGVLSAMVGGIPLLRKDRGEEQAFVTALARLHVSGAAVDWSALFEGTGARRVDLPTYAFQHERYWPTVLDVAPIDRSKSTVDSWRHRESWERITPRGSVSGTWLVLGAENDFAREVAAAVTGTIVQEVPETPFDGIVSLLALDDEVDENGVPRGVIATMELIQSLARKGVSAPVWVVTRGAQTSSAQSAAWGLGRVAALELPAQWGGLVDITGAVSQLAAVLVGDEAEVEIRAEGVFARRYGAADPADAMWEPHGTVIVTGGTGALGTHVARDLKERGVEKIVLVSRRGLDAPIAAELQELGAEIVACDVADRASVRQLLDRYEPNAIVHTAGVLSDGVLEGLAPERFEDVFRSKVASALVLDELTRDRELDAFVLFSSVAGALGNPGQANYAAANAVLDAIARDRRSNGLPATSIAWGAWAGSGMADGVGADLSAIMMRPDLAVESMWRAVAEDAPTVAIAILPEKPKARKKGAVSGGVLEVVRTAVASVLGYVGPHAVGVDKEFRDLGFDSLTAVELRNQLSAATGRTLPASLVYDYPTPRRLADHLRGGSAEAEVTSARADEPIAIVGMACRFPGDVNTPEELWQLLLDGRDGMGAFPVDRDWDVESVLSTSITREAGFLAGTADFDPAFFGISPREAMAMDPQQRFLLETTWEALERVGVDPLSLRGSQTGVFVGTNGQDYATLLTSSSEDTEGHAATGLAASVISGRLSYTFGFEGPAVTVDTACSASLVAMHLAVQALRGGECSLAVSGGATIMTTPYAFAELTRQGALAANGRSKAFSDDADGAGWSEGVGMVVMERLSDAVRNGHRVLAVIRGSAVNQDGASNGLTAPNGPSQQRVIRAALANAGLSVGDVDAVEAHGTGTALGDPIEAQALINTYGADRATPLWLGSVKSNIGHTQAAAGVAGVIKMVLALQHNLLPQTLHVAAPSSHVDWSEGAVELLTEACEWSPNGHARRAGVSAFGISGTNAHMILEEAPASTASSDSVDGPRPGSIPLVVSAKSPASLRARIEQVRALEGDAVDIAFSLLTTRSVFDHRAVLIGDEVVQGVAQESAPVFIFPGQGSQWHGMAVELLDEDETFARSMAECDEAIGKLVDWSVIDVLRGEAELLERIEVLQPTLFAVMVSLAQTWRKNGVEPAAVVGHSQGEIAAAHVAGALSLDEAAKIVVLRSQLFADELVGNGAVASVALPVEEAQKLIERWPVLSIAGINSPAACTVAGALKELNEFVELCQAREIRARVVASTVASHGPQVEPLREKLMSLLGTITPRSSDIAFYSTVKAERIDTATLDAGYWYENARRPIEFVAVTRKLIDDGYRVFVESSPHPVLTMSAQATADADGTELVTVGTLRRDQGGKARFTTSLAEAWVAGLDVEWRYPGGRKIDLPTYPFSRSRFWPKAGTKNVNAEDSAFWQLVENGDLTEALGVDAENVVPALREWRAKQQTQSTVDGWRYRDSWQLLRGVQATGINGTWLAAVPEQTDEWTEAVLRTFGADLVRVTVRPDAERALLATELIGIEPVGVISLLGTENTPHHEFTSTPVGLALNVLLLQALGDAGSTAPFWAVTKQAISTGATDLVRNPEQVALWGLGRVAALDLPRRWGGLVDLPETIDGQIGQGLVAAITNEGGEDQLAVRDTGVHGRR
ncbi:SDR family NAD(P)-dependent oxidoreductase, partial [Lentzea sp. PSKA42]